MLCYKSKCKIQAQFLKIQEITQMLLGKIFLADKNLFLRLTAEKMHAFVVFTKKYLWLR